MTANFADTYNPLVKLLHDGPGRLDHLRAGRLASSGGVVSVATPEPFLASAAPKMPALRDMHETVAADARAQAKFFLLMSGLHHCYILGVERLHIGRFIMSAPRRPLQDTVAASLQPSIAPGITDAASISACIYCLRHVTILT